MTEKEIKAEFKTIRISASTYYKLVELTGLINTATGINFSLTNITDLIIGETYNQQYSAYAEIVGNPKKYAKNRVELQKRINSIIDSAKNVKIQR